MGLDEIAGNEEDKWGKRGRKIIQRYRAEEQGRNDPHRFNILWSNVQTLLPTLYARTPKADVQRRFLDQDDTGRLASLLLERALSYTLEHTGFDALMWAAVEDRLLPGRGTARVMYVPHFGDPIPDDAEFEDSEAADAVVDSAGDEDKPPPREVTYEEAIAAYLYWEDYREGPARTWRQVPWVRYRAYMDREELVERFGAKGKLVQLDINPKGKDNSKAGPSPDIFKKAEIFEFWDKSKKEVIWLAPQTPDIILDRQPDPLRLPDFFPSPDPLLSTTTTSNRIPVPDYVEYQDQADELDVLTGRIDTLTRALKVSGIYAGSLKAELQQLLDPGMENKLIPVPDWQGLADKGGLEGIIQWMPIKQIAEVLIQLYDAREKTKSLLYEVTGIGDIMRGETNPNETAAAQKLKSNFSTRRILPQQQKVARFARDMIRLLAGVIAEHFQPQTISMITGYPQLAPVPQVPPEPPAMLPGPSQPGLPPQPGMPPQGQPGMPQMQPNPAHDQWMQAMQAAQQVQMENQQKQQQFEAACQLIKSDGVRGFKLEIEADSTIAPDEQAEKQDRVEFLQQMVPLLQQVVPIAQGNPPLAEMASQMALFAMRAFRVARPLEEAFEKGFAAIAKMPPVPPPGGHKGPDPALEQAKMQASLKETQMKAAAQQADTQAKTQTAMVDTQARAQGAAHDAEIKAQTDQMAITQKMQQAQLKAQSDADRLAMEHQHHAEKMGLEIEKMQTAERMAVAKIAATEAKSARGLE